MGRRINLTGRRTLLRFMGAMGAGLALPGIVYAQAAKKIPTVAVLYAGDSDDDAALLRPFFDKMNKNGWTEGKTVAYDRHSGKGTRPYLVAHRLEWAEAGAVLTYGADVSESHKRAARIASRILKGEKPAQIPVERVQKFELAINSRVANELALHIPKPLLQRADKVFG